MNVTAVICEYNLLHNGHLRQLEAIRAAYPDTVILSLMSGSFVQRGEPAILPPYLRAEAAVRSGCDLVLELSYPYCMSASQYFALGAVRILEALGCVNRLCFGSESGSLEELTTASRRLREDSFNDELRRRASNGSKRYAVLRDELYRELYGENCPVHPNDILGVEYLSALAQTGSVIKPFTIKREGEDSATACRRLYRDRDFKALEQMIPPAMLSICREHQPTDIENAASLLLGCLRMSDPADFEGIAETGSGLEYRIAEAAGKAVSVSELYNLLATKRYTDARLRRAVMSALLGIRKTDLEKPPSYTTVLAANAKGRAVIARMKKTSIIPVITRPGVYTLLPEPAKESFAAMLRAEGLYGLMCSPPQPYGTRLKSKPYIET
ncbi:MAG: nucleotidyltransferase family protein [Clostridiales bacterium]|nr:nucleotidyltransferase family protein [Clostridiales bacterium]